MEKGESLMPLYKYKCTCGFVFEKISDEDIYPCPRCEEFGKRVLTAGRFSFQFVPTGPKPQNTGATSIDHDPDRVIGESAKKNLAEYQGRSDNKRRIIERNKLKAGDYLSREVDDEGNDTGDYFVMEEEERKAAKKARLVHQDAMKQINEHIKKKMPDAKF